MLSFLRIFVINIIGFISFRIFCMFKCKINMKDKKFLTEKMLLNK